MTDSTTTVLATWAAHNLLPLVLSAVSMFLIPIARHYAALLKDENLRRIATSAITLAEESANQQAAAGTKVTGSEKLDTAVAAIMEKVPGIDKADAAQLVHEELPKVRAALGDFGQATLRAALASPIPAPQPSPVS